VNNCLRDFRKERGLRQAELADALEISRSTIIAIEADKYDPSLPMAYRLSAYFDVPVEAIFFNPWRE
jgi:putative transcriptional regulator